jgi:hypothetical protein
VPGVPGVRGTDCASRLGRVALTPGRGVSIQPISTSSGETSSQLSSKYFVSVKPSPAAFSFATIQRLPKRAHGDVRAMPQSCVPRHRAHMAHADPSSASCPDQR